MNAFLLTVTLDEEMHCEGCPCLKYDGRFAVYECSQLPDLSIEIDTSDVRKFSVRPIECPLRTTTQVIDDFKNEMDVYFLEQSKSRGW